MVIHKNEDYLKPDKRGNITMNSIAAMSPDESKALMLAADIMGLIPRP